MRSLEALYVFAIEEQCRRMIVLRVVGTTETDVFFGKWKIGFHASTKLLGPLGFIHL